MSGEVWGKPLSVQKLRIESLFILSSESYGLFLWLRSQRVTGHKDESRSVQPGNSQSSGDKKQASISGVFGRRFGHTKFKNLS